MRIGIIGFGYWGTILARCFARAPHVEICCIADIAPERLVEARRQFPNAVLTAERRHACSPKSLKQRPVPRVGGGAGGIRTYTYFPSEKKGSAG